jgi:DNA-binding LytR/AlgR family response regulator
MLQQNQPMPFVSISRSPNTKEGNYVPDSFIEPGKRSFLVFARNKYLMVPTENIAFFYVKFKCTIIVTFENQEYSVKYSLEQVQNLLPDHQFFRLNRQCLINLNAIREVEHYFARRLVVNPVISFAGKLLVSRENARNFLNWLESR